MRVGFDIGGTFTDVMILDKDKRLTTAKVLSLLDRVGDHIAAQVKDLTTEEGVDAFVHGTTSASNAVIEGKTGRTGLITTHGFRDELELRGQRGPNGYLVNWQRLPALIPRSRRLEVRERILATGNIDQPLDLAQAEDAVRQLLKQEVEAIAVCLINAYRNPLHEQQIGALIRRLAPHVAVCLSSDVDPEIKEYERSSTTAVNACLIPVFDAYMDKLEAALSPLSKTFLIMQSNGGVMSASAARLKPAAIIESGPAAGVLAAARLAQDAKLMQALSFDMGGTTAKACLVENGQPLEKQGGEVAGGVTSSSGLASGGGYAVRCPWLDIVEVGAGGGSIGWIDPGGALRVGPESAGAQPGPVCYGRGGQKPTVTDANVVLGYIDPHAIAGGTLAINREAAWNAIDLHLAQPLGISVLDAAYGIVRVANASMMRALRAVSTERGRDPREFTLVAYGGSGPLHAAELAATLGIRRIYVPIYSGLFSALGLLLADYRHDAVRCLATSLENLDGRLVMQMFDALEATARREIAQHVGPAEVIATRHVDLKYGYQMSTLTLPLSESVTGVLEDHLKQQFSAEHLRQFAYTTEDAIELINIRVRLTANVDKLRLSDLAPPESSGPRERPLYRDAYFGPNLGTKRTQVINRAKIRLNDSYVGPVVVEQPDSTTVVPPGWSLTRDAAGSLILDAQ